MTAEKTMSITLAAQRRILLRAARAPAFGDEDADRAADDSL